MLKLIKAAFVIVVLCFGFQQCTSKESRPQKYVAPPEFNLFLKRHQEQQKQTQLLFKIAPLPLPLLYEYEEDSAGVGMNVRIEAGEKALGLTKSEIVLRNPYSPKPFPLSNSIIYHNNLVTLFDPGYFACYHISNQARDEQFERQLNTRMFQYHWLIGGQLIGLSKGEYYAFSTANGWVPYTAEVPFNKQPKLFEDERYLSFLTCNGEFGGEVYFYDKRQHHYYLTGATCPNSVFKQDGKYFVLSSLGHMMGSADLQVIADPAKLRIWQGKQNPQNRKLSYGKQAPDTTGVSASKVVFDFYEMQVFSAFRLNGHLYYMVYWQNQTFLATIAKGVITVVDPLFNKDLYTHHPVTMNYAPDLVLMNLDFYGLAREKEVACILIAGTRVLKINWNDEKSNKALSTGKKRVLSRIHIAPPSSKLRTALASSTPASWAVGPGGVPSPDSDAPPLGHASAT